MLIHLNYNDLILLAGIALSIIMAIAFGIKSRKQIANVWLSAFFIVSGIVITVKFLYSTGYIIHQPHWFKVHYPAGILRPVFIYLYVYFLFEKREKIKRIYLLHFIPFIILLIYLAPFFVQNSSYKLSVLNGQLDNTLGLIPAWYVHFQYAYTLAYLVLAYVVVRRYTGNQLRLSKLERAMIKWTIFVLIGGFVYIILGVLSRLANFTGEYNYYLDVIFSILLILYSIKLLTLPEIVNPDRDFKVKYKRSTLTENDKDLYFLKIKQIMTTENLYKRNDLKISDLAGKVVLHEYLTSQIINERSGQSFPDFLNSFRITEAKKMLSTSRQNYSIDGIAYEVGFNSRSAFYNAFKKITDLTPSEYLKSIE